MYHEHRLIPKLLIPSRDGNAGHDGLVCLMAAAADPRAVVRAPCHASVADPGGRWMVMMVMAMMMVVVTVMVPRRNDFLAVVVLGPRLCSEAHGGRLICYSSQVSLAEQAKVTRKRRELS